MVANFQVSFAVEYILNFQTCKTLPFFVSDVRSFCTEKTFITFFFRKNMSAFDFVGTEV